MENKVQEILSFKLIKEVNDVSRHATIIQLKGVWWIYFDFARRHRTSTWLQLVHQSEDFTDRQSTRSIVPQNWQSLPSYGSLRLTFLDQKKKKDTTIDQMFPGTSKVPTY